MYWVKLGFAVTAKYTPNLDWETLSLFEIVVGSKSAPFEEDRRQPDSVAIAAKVKYVFICFSEWSRSNCSQRLDIVDPVRWRTKALSGVKAMFLSVVQ